jgi:endonuclease/exonuclease/phosphatase (EEP) superfamily protein YafD
MKPAPLPGPAASHHGRATLRVITLNCGLFAFGDPTADLAAWQPDIILIQEARPHQVRRIADSLFSGQGDYRCHQTNGLVTRWHIDREIRNTTNRDQQATVLLPNGNKLEVVNIHLASAATDLRLWQRAAWRDPRNNRVLHRQELATILQVLDQTIDLPTTPTLLGGDFNSPASAPLHRLLTRDFTDAFTAAGTGWGNTFQRRAPILRIDHIYANRHLTPIRCRAVTTRYSDHRMVIADFLTDALDP